MSLDIEGRRRGGINRALNLSAKRRKAIARAGGLARAEKVKPVVSVTDADTAETALTLLQSIRTQFRKLGCEKTAIRLDAAISSAKGAVRTLRVRSKRSG